MRKVILLMHVSLDGFVAGPEGEMDWINVESEMFDDVAKLTNEADTAIYGRVTFRMMENYWPTAGEKATATKHDIEHSRWANNAVKVVFSKTLKETAWKNTRIYHEDVAGEIAKLKAQPGMNMLLIGSPGLAQTFMRHNLLDEYRLYVNPIILGTGIPLFKHNSDRVNLTLKDIKQFHSGVLGLHYETRRK
jgi:dihydrofolate reductase